MISIVASVVAWGILGFHAAASAVCKLFELFGSNNPEPLAESYHKQWGDPYVHHPRRVGPGTYQATVRTEDRP